MPAHLAVRRQAALVHEAAPFITDARRMFPQVASFIDGLEAKARDGCERVIGAVESGSPHYLGEWLENHRNVTHHYPKMHPAAAQQEEMASALAEAPTSRAPSTAARASVRRASAMRMRLAYSCCRGSTTRAGWRGCAIRR